MESHSVFITHSLSSRPHTPPVFTYTLPISIRTISTTTLLSSLQTTPIHSPSLRFTTPIHSVEESLTPINTPHNNTLSFNFISTRFSYSISTRFILHESSSPFSLPLSVSRHPMLTPLPFNRNPFPDEIGGATHIFESTTHPIRGVVLIKTNRI